MSRANSRGPTTDWGKEKRLIVACDGTWLNSDKGLEKGMIEPPSNVTRICRAIKTKSSDGIAQIVYYQAGVGTEGGVISRAVGGATGAGLAENVRAAYDFLSNNYTLGDEIYLLGFSRGAFTARSIAGFIDSIGVLTKAGLPAMAEIFEDFEMRWDPDYQPAYPDVPFPNKPNIRDPGYSRELERRGLTILGVTIKAVAVWETVGSLGIPRVGWLEMAGLQSRKMKEYKFYNTAIGDCIDNAFQALALDERRGPFSPAVWEKPRGNMTNLRQVWFPGVHSNIGGGYNDQELANITLAWMMSQLQPFIDFYDDFVIEQYNDNRSYYKKTGQRVRPWSFGYLYNSSSSLFALGGSKTRTPGAYYRIDSSTGRPTSKPLRNTNEYIHPSVRTRITRDGPGEQDRSFYDPPALQNWKISVSRDNSEKVQAPTVLWKSRTSKKTLPESPLWVYERQLLEMDPDTFDYLMKPTRRSGR